MKKFFKWLAYLAAALILLLTAIAGLTQTPFFRDKLRKLALDNLDTLLVAETHLGEIHGNLISGFSIDSVSIRIHDDYLISTERIDLRYDLLQIPSKRIRVSNLMLVRPRISLLRGRDSVWNFERMIRPTPDDTTSNPFTWPISVERFEIKNGLVCLIDSAALGEPGHRRDTPYYVEYHDLTLRNFDLLVAAVLISPNEKRATITSLSFVSEKPDVHLQKLSGKFLVTNKEARVEGLAIRTSHSTVKLDAILKGVDLLDGFELLDLRAKPVEVSLQTSPLDLNELERFIPEIDFLDGDVILDLKAAGPFGGLNVKQLDLKNRSSELYFAGQVSNLHKPENLFLHIQCRGSRIAYDDVRSLMPTIELPDGNVLGVAKLNFDFDGEPLDFKTNFEIETDAGSLSTHGAQLKIGGSESLRYAGEFTARNFNIAAITGDDKATSKLNGNISINGYGTSLDNVNAEVEAALDSSLVAGHRIGESHISVTSVNKKLSGIVNLNIGSMAAELEAELDRTNSAVPAFRVDGSMTSVNLAEFLDDESQSSNLTMNIHAKGTGLAWENLNCMATLDLSPSRYKEYQIDSGLVAIAIDQRDPMHSSIKVRSSLADFSIDGQFDLDYMVGLIRYEVENLSLAVGERFRVLDSTLATTTDVKELFAFGNRLKAKNKVLDAEYELNVKDLEPFSILAGNRTFDAVGDIKGTLKGNYENLSGDATLTVREFFYGNADSGMLIQDGLATLRFTDLLPVAPLSELRLRTKVDAGKMHINRTKLDTFMLGVFYDKEYAGFVAQADYDRNLHLRTNGQIGISDDGVEFTFSNLQAAYKEFLWRANDGAEIIVNRSGLRAQNFGLQRDTQRVLLSGAFLSGGTLDASLTLSDMNLENLKYFLSQEERTRDARGFEGIVNLDIRLGGTLRSPTYDAKIRAERVFYRGFPFGVIEGDLHYANQQLSTELQIDNPAVSRTGRPDLIVEGTLPMDLAFTDVAQRLPDKEMHLNVHSEGLQMSLLDPLVPTFNDLTGILRMNLTVGGVPRRPMFSGTMSIEQCRFLFEPNNMYYKLDGEFRPEGERINVTNAVVRNVEEDNKPGRVGAIAIEGSMAFREFVPSDFNYRIKGKLLVVNKNTRTSGLAVYGELPVETAPEGITYTGNIERSLLKGSVFVNNSNLAFPPTAASAREDTFFILMKVVDDTVKEVQKELLPTFLRYFSSIRHSDSIAQATGFFYTPSFVDGLRYDLSVDFQGGNNQIRMIFNPATNEELVANITGKALITEDGKMWNGRLNVSRATYNFYGKRFDAEGTMNYTGDLFNPELNIVATYKGARKYDDSSPDESVVVTYKISGTRLAPKPDIVMSIDGIDYYSYNARPTSNDLQSDALTFIITNNFPLSRGQRNDIAAQVGPTVRTGLLGGATSLLTSAFSEFLRSKTGFINSFEFNYDNKSGDSFEQKADIRLGGTAFKGYWRYGGKILEDPFTNANLSILYSFGDIFDRSSLRNFMFEIERKVDTSTLIGGLETRKEVNSARFFYRFSF